MNYVIDIQVACHEKLPFSNELIARWVELTLAPHRPRAEVTLRFVDNDEMTQLNKTYREQDKTTNVLAFPASYPADIELDYPLLGDVIICPAVLFKESQTLRTPLENHWAHIIIHGLLHLLGYDHIIDDDADIMRPIEIKLLKQLGFENPYNTEDYTLD